MTNKNRIFNTNKYLMGKNMTGNYFTFDIHCPNHKLGIST